MKKLAVVCVALAVCLPNVAYAKKKSISCKSFSSQAEAQAYYNAKKPGYKKLDRDGDGRACEKK